MQQQLLECREQRGTRLGVARQVSHAARMVPSAAAGNASSPSRCPKRWYMRPPPHSRKAWRRRQGLEAVDEFLVVAGGEEAAALCVCRSQYDFQQR
jgi:hypothetical protein